MKRVIKASLIALLVAVTAPAISNAQTTVMGGPYTNLKATGQVIHLALSNYPSTAGLCHAVRKERDFCSPISM
jgi:hypothetical protein